MSTIQMEALSALLELGEKSLNEGDYVKLANFLKDLNHSPRPVLLKTLTNNLEITLEFETQDGKQMRICIDSMRTSIYQGNIPNKEIAIGSINGTPVEMDERELINKVKLIYNLYGMKNIKRSTSLCEPLIYETMGEFKLWSNDHMKADVTNPDERDDLDSDNWNASWLFRKLCGLNDE